MLNQLSHKLVHAALRVRLNSTWFDMVAEKNYGNVSENGVYSAVTATHPPKTKRAHFMIPMECGHSRSKKQWFR